MKLMLKAKIFVYWAIFGIVLLVLGILLGYDVFPLIVSKNVWEHSVLKENTSQWNLFKKIPFPFQTKVYFFNVQNANDIEQGAKPVVKEIGPYIYKLQRWKDDIEWNGDEISYYDYMRFDFDPEASGQFSDEDSVTVLNSARNALIFKVEDISPSALESLDDALPRIFGRHDGLFVTAKVKELLFEGITLCEDGGGDHFTAKIICKRFKAAASAAKGMIVEGNSINYSYLRFKNNTHLGRFTIQSGLTTKEETSTLIKYNNASYVSTWRNSSCNEVRSSTTFRPYVTPEMTFDVFSEDICRRLQMVYETVETVKGVEGYKYVLRNDSFNASKVDTEISCYCINKSKTLTGEYGCLNDGILDLSNCVGAPVLLSFPHLLYGAEEYLKSVEGLLPDKKRHQNFVVLEPTSGTPLKAAKRVQFNMFIRPVQDIISTENVTQALVPIFWIEESMTLEDQYISLLQKSLLNKLKILEAVKWGLIIVGTIIVITSNMLLICKKI